jgi:hypothetical protein
MLGDLHNGESSIPDGSTVQGLGRSLDDWTTGGKYNPPILWIAVDAKAI